MVECDIADLELDERVRRIVDGIGAPPVSCGHCRQPGASLRCSRCKCVKYCSVACQKEHFALHKKNCKSISKKRTSVEKNWAAERPISERHGDHDVDAMTELSLSYLTVTVTIEMADLLVQVGYRESDTITNGMLYYREALAYYLMPLKLLGDAYHMEFPWFEDRMILLLVILGGDESHTQAWFMESDSQRRLNYFPASELSHMGKKPTFELEGFSKDDLPFQAMLLLSQMKLMATYRRSFECLEVCKETMRNAATALGYSSSMDDIVTHMSPFLMGETHKGKVELEVLPEQISTIISVLVHHKRGGFLTHLKNSIPFKREYAPKLFASAHYNPEFFPGVEDAAAPPEFWMIYQDCFFETPGLNDILHEFLPEED